MMSNALASLMLSMWFTPFKLSKFIAAYAIKKRDSAVFLYFFIFSFVFSFVVVPPAHAAPEVVQWQHPNGARVAWVGSPNLPMLDIRLEFDGGSRRDPPTQTGLAAVTAMMSQRGLAAHGTQTALDENQWTERWMDYGAQWSVSASADRLSVSLRTLTAPDVLEPVIDFAAASLAHPDWDSEGQQAIWTREKARLTAAWQEAQTQPATIAQRRFSEAVYGNHPYGDEATPETWERIRLSDMRQHWHTHVRPCDARISVVGAVTQSQADALVTRLLAPLMQRHTACPRLPVIAEVAPLTQASHQAIPMQTAQAHIWLGQPGHRRHDPDFFPLMLGNYILGGGGFVSRLTTEVREKRGLTYGIYSTFQPGMHAGAFVVSVQTRPDQAEQALTLTRQVIEHFVTDGPTEAEVQAAKTYMVNGFALRLDSNRKLLDNVANILWFDLPGTYLSTWTDTMQRVTVADIQRAFTRVLHPQRMASVVVGGPSANAILPR